MIIAVGETNWYWMIVLNRDKDTGLYSCYISKEILFTQNKNSA